MGFWSEGAAPQVKSKYKLRKPGGAARQSLRKFGRAAKPLKTVKTVERTGSKAGRYALKTIRTAKKIKRLRKRLTRKKS